MTLFFNWVRALHEGLVGQCPNLCLDLTTKIKKDKNNVIKIGWPGLLSLSLWQRNCWPCKKISCNQSPKKRMNIKMHIRSNKLSYLNIWYYALTLMKSLCSFILDSRQKSKIFNVIIAAYNQIQKYMKRHRNRLSSKSKFIHAHSNTKREKWTVLICA